MKVHPKISQILLLHGPFFTCPFCKTLIVKSQDHYDHHCPNENCSYIFIVNGLYLKDYKNIAVIKFKIEQIHINLDFEKNQTTLSSINKSYSHVKRSFSSSSFYSIEPVLTIDAITNFNYRQPDSIKEKLKLLLTFS